MSRAPGIDGVVAAIEVMPSGGHVEVSSISLYLRLVCGWSPRKARRALRDAIALGAVTRCAEAPERLEVAP